MSVTSANIPLAAQALDKAIVRVAKSEYDDLSRRLSLKQQSERIASVFHQFDEMAKRKGQPDFDDRWTALFYLTWYHPHQINLFYSIFRSLLAGQAAVAPPCPTFQIADLGCGALAAQMGLVLAYYNAFESDCTPHVAITNIDHSKSMTRIGARLWAEWQQGLYSAGLADLSDFCNAIPFKIAHHRVAKVSNVNENAIRFLIASNVAFPSNLDSVRGALRRIWLDMSPNRAVVTTIGPSVKIEEMVSAFPGAARARSENPPPAGISGSLKAVTQWRMDLRHRLNHYSADMIVPNFLDQEVSWDWSYATAVGHFLADAGS